MKKYKIQPKNSYYHYKRRKNKLIKIFMVILIGVVVVGIFLGVERFSKAIAKMTTMTSNGASDKQTKEETVYFNGAEISYNLYRMPREIRGIYIPARKVVDYEKYITLTKNTSVNAFVIDVKNDKGYLTYLSTNPKLIKMGCVLDDPPIQDLKKVMNRLYEEGIYPIARIVAFKDNVASKKFPDRAVKDKAGNLYTKKDKDTWLNPYDKRNWEYLLEISKDAINMGFKEVQFDYIRFHESMNKETILLDHSLSKTEIITAFTKYMRDHLKDYDVCLSADVFGAIITSSIDADIVGQDFKELSKNLDYICPMVYPSHYAQGSFGIQYPHLDAYDIILRSMEFAQDELSKNPREERQAIIRPWLQDFTMTKLKPYQPYGQKQIKDQIKGSNDAGLSEWLFWNASGEYTETGLQDK